MTHHPPIVPCLWFDNEGEEAVALYTSLFSDSAKGGVLRFGKAGQEVHGRSEGSVMSGEFRLAGRSFTALNGGPLFKFTPAASLFVHCGSEADVDRLWNRLVADGEVLMPLDRYEWSDRYGWLSDRYGLSWQIMLDREPREGIEIAPSLLFTGDVAGKAEAAMHTYMDIFPASAIVDMHRYGPGEQDHKGYVKYARFTLAGRSFSIMDSSVAHGFGFTEAFSFQVLCDSQSEIDRYWEALRAGGDPAAQQCGWLKDRFGVSWQIVPSVLSRLLAGPDRAAADRVMNALLEMGKLDIAALEAAHAGRPAA